MARPNCVVVDYGIGNVFSVLRALERLGFSATLCSDHSKILASDRIILPGVGAFARAASELRARGLDEVIRTFVATGKPFLGICVGMQLLLDASEEFGLSKGLGIIPGTVRMISARDNDGSRCRVPLIGWCPVMETYEGAWRDTPFANLRAANTFYFVHSFQANVVDPSNRTGAHSLGTSAVTSAVVRDNVLGVQFHPERSAEAGHQFLDAFMSQTF